MDKRLRELERAGGLPYLLARSRIEGSDVFLEPLAGGLHTRIQEAILSLTGIEGVEEPSDDE